MSLLGDYSFSGGGSRHTRRGLLDRYALAASIIACLVFWTAIADILYTAL
jgi:hypothetical protein